MENEKELNSQVDRELVSVSAYDMDMDEVVSRAEKQVELIDKCMAISIKKTNQSDWIDMGGKPYLASSGAEKIRGLFGVRVSTPVREKTVSKDEKGEFYIYACYGEVSSNINKAPLSAMGACTSRDDFFAMTTGHLGGTVKSMRPIL